MSNDVYSRLDQEPEEWTADKTLVLRHAPIDVPLDLREWFVDKALLAWVVDEIEARQKAANFVHSQPEASDDRRKLLAVIWTFALCTNRFELSTLLLACQKQEPFQSLCGTNDVSHAELDHFRRANRSLLHQAVANVLLTAMSRKFEIPIGNLPTAVHRDVRSRAEERLDIARHLSSWDE